MRHLAAKSDFELRQQVNLLGDKAEKCKGLEGSLQNVLATEITAVGFIDIDINRGGGL
jgi:hypothetical protein